MSITKELFGRLEREGRAADVFAYTMKNENGMQVKILNYGGTIAEIKVPDRNGCFSDVIGGYDCLDSYVRGDGYQGALIGRWGNRINKGKFTLEGKEYSLFINNNSNHFKQFILSSICHCFCSFIQINKPSQMQTIFFKFISQEQLPSTVNRIEEQQNAKHF